MRVSLTILVVSAAVWRDKSPERSKTYGITFAFWIRVHFPQAGAATSCCATRSLGAVYPQVGEADDGVTALWLLPFYPSPLRDDGYDIADYRNVHPDYGTLHDLKVFVQKAHAYGLKVITELVVNHTSDQHPWFQAARRARPGSRKRNYYVWSDTDTKYAETRVIFLDTEK